MPFNIGPFELLLVLILALLVLGPGKLPEVGNALGKTIREFRRASTDVEEGMRLDAPPTQRPAQPVNELRDPDPDRDRDPDRDPDRDRDRDKAPEPVGTEAKR